MRTSIKLPGFSRPHRQTKGAEAEKQALAYLKRKGLKLVAKNVNFRGGEIDLVMQDGETLVFVEVRYRSSKSFGGAAASVTPTKQKRIIVAAQHYLLSLQQTPPCRFDVVAIDGQEQAEWIRDAFGVQA